MSVDGRDLVRLEQGADAAGQSGNDAVLASYHRSDVHFGAADGYAVGRKLVLDLVKLLGRVEQRFRRNAAHVETGSTERGIPLGVAPLVHAGRAQAELGAANGADVAGRAGPNEDDIE